MTAGIVNPTAAHLAHLSENDVVTVVFDQDGDEVEVTGKPRLGPLGRLLLLGVTLRDASAKPGPTLRALVSPLPPTSTTFVAGQVVIDPDGIAWQRDSEGVWVPASDAIGDSLIDADVADFEVIFTPGQKTSLDVDALIGHLDRCGLVPDARVGDFRVAVESFNRRAVR